MRYVRGPEFLEALVRLAARLDPAAVDAIVGLKRSGLFPAVFLSHQLGRPMFSDAEIDRIPPALGRILVADSVVRTGRSMERVKRRLVRAGKRVQTAVLYKENASTYPVDVSLETHDALVHFFYERLRWTPADPP